MQRHIFVHNFMYFKKQKEVTRITVSEASGAKSEFWAFPDFGG